MGLSESKSQAGVEGVFSAEKDAPGKDEEEVKAMDAETQGRKLFKQLSLDALDDEHRSGCDPMAALTTPRQLGAVEPLPFGNEHPLSTGSRSSLDADAASPGAMPISAAS